MATRKSTKSTTPAPRDAYNVVTDRIIAALEAGTIPWRRPWTAGDSFPRNAVTGRRYSGANVLVLTMSEYSDPRWLTFRQALALGGNVRKGEHGTGVVFWKFLQRTRHADGTPLVEGERAGQVPLLRYFTVFNVEQCDGLDAERLAPWEQDAETFDPIVEADTITRQFFEAPGAPRFTHNGGSRAFYVPAQDHIHLPKQSAFTSNVDYYATLFHEMGHSTGHASRLNRHGLETGIGVFGSEVYSREELAAEMTSAFLAAAAGLDTTTLPQNAAYIASWLKALKDDRKLLVVAASQGQKAADYILDAGDADDEDDEEAA